MPFKWFWARVDARVVTTRHGTTILSLTTHGRCTARSLLSSNYKPDQNGSSSAFAVSRTWQPANTTTYDSLSPPKAPTAYLSSRLSLGGFGLAPITELSEPPSGRGDFAHCVEELGEEHTQRRMTHPKVSTHCHPTMDQGSATTHHFLSTNPHSPTRPQFLESERSFLQQ